MKIIIEKKSSFEGIEFYEKKFRVTNDEPQFRFIPKTSNLDQSKKLVFALKEDASAFLTDKFDPKKRMHNVKA